MRFQHEVGGAGSLSGAQHAVHSEEGIAVVVVQRLAQTRQGQHLARLQIAHAADQPCGEMAVSGNLDRAHAVFGDHHLHHAALHVLGRHADIDERMLARAVGILHGAHQRVEVCAGERTAEIGPHGGVEGRAGKQRQPAHGDTLPQAFRRNPRRLHRTGAVDENQPAQHRNQRRTVRRQWRGLRWDRNLRSAGTRRHLRQAPLEILREGEGRQGQREKCGRCKGRDDPAARFLRLHHCPPGAPRPIVGAGAS